MDIDTINNILKHINSIQSSVCSDIAKCSDCMYYDIMHDSIGFCVLGDLARRTRMIKHYLAGDDTQNVLPGN